MGLNVKKFVKWRYIIFKKQKKILKIVNYKNLDKYGLKKNKNLNN
uniref:Uncharacterized protein n=1 Tax=Rhizophora mucronata TaxID=61149 RepID=A0A2P2PX12_RHIMU